MGQWELYEIIQNLGGRASRKQIMQYIQERKLPYGKPFVDEQATRLRKAGLIQYDYSPGKSGRFVIIAPFPERNIVQ